MSEEVTINIKGPNELKLPISIALDKTVKDLKAAIAEKSDVEADRQRLIYSGRVLKDDDVLSTYKIQTNHTIHMVKGVVRSQPESSTPQRLPTMHAGQNPTDPATILNSHQAFGGALAGFNPFADMGINTNDPNMLQNMMDSPQFVQQMSDMMARPEFMEQMMANDPMLRDNPQMQQMFRSPQFQAIMRNPEVLRSIMQMANSQGGSAGAPGMFGAGRGAAPFGFPPMGGFPAAQPNMFGVAPAASSPAGSTPGATGASGAPNPASPTGAAPFAMPDPAMLAQLMAAMGGGGGGSHNPYAGGGFGGFGGGLGTFGGGAAATPSVPSGPPPEERFQTQLQQLSDMGFTNARQNVRALLATGGNVNHAIEYILGGGGAD